MDKEIFRRFEDEVNRNWRCDCGSLFQEERLEIISKGEESLIARYSCQVCSREKMFAVSTGGSDKKAQLPMLDIPSNSVTSNDVLDIKKDASTIKTDQIKLLARKKKRIKAASLKVSAS